MLVWGLRCVAYSEEFVRELKDKYGRWLKTDQGSQSKKTGSRRARPTKKAKTKAVTETDSGDNTSLSDITQDEGDSYLEDSDRDDAEPASLETGGTRSRPRKGPIGLQ
jgi:hypothetical protein